MRRVHKRKSKSNQIRFIVWSVVIATISICVIDIMVMAFPFYADRLPQAVSGEIDYASVVETNLLSTCMAIIGIAVAVWAGLNLIQVLERKMFIELNEHVQQFEDERKSVYRKRFMVGLIHSDNSLDKYFYEKMAALKESDYEDISLVMFYELCLFQEADFFARIDVKKNMSRADYQYYTERIDEIDQILRAYADIEPENRCMKIMTEYLMSRKADIYFNIGYGVEGREKYQAYRRTIDLYERLYPELKFAKWKEISTDNIGKIIGEETRIEVQVREGIINYCLHILNTYAEAYSCLLFSVKDASWIEMGQTCFFDKDKIASMENVFDCILRVFAENESADIKKNPNRRVVLRDELKEFVYRNYGAFLERYYKAGFNVKGRGLKAIEHSIKCAKGKINLSEAQIKQIFDLYVSAIDTTLFSKDRMKAKESSFYALGSFWHKISEGKDILGMAKRKRRYWNFKILSEMLEKVEYYMDLGCGEFHLNYNLQLILVLVYRDKALLKLIDDHGEEAVGLYKIAKSRYEKIWKLHGDDLEQSNNKFYKTLADTMWEVEDMLDKNDKDESEAGKLTGYPSIDKPWLKYYTAEAINASLPQMTMYEYIWENNKNWLSDNAFQYFGAKITYRELFDNVKKTAKAFKAIGIKTGDIVTIMSMHTPETIYALYGLNYLGAVANLVYMTLTEKEVLQTLENTESKVFMVLDSALETIEKIKDKVKIPIVIFSVADSMPFSLKTGYNLKNSKIRKRIKDHYQSYQEFIKKGSSENGLKATSNHEAIAVIVYTSGTTGEPKGVCLSNDNLNAIVENSKWTDRNDKRGESTICLIPQFLGYGVSMLHLYISVGIFTDLFIIMDNDAIGKEFDKFRPDRLVTGPPLLDGIMKHVKGDLSNVIEITGGGSQISLEKEKEFNEFLNTRGSKTMYLSGYGMTECGSAVILNMSYAYRPGSLGVPFKDVSVRIEDVDSRKELGYLEVGEICIHGPSTMVGYFKNKNATDEVIFYDNNGERWIRSGDLGYIDNDGFVYAKGRIKRVYLTQGKDGIYYRIFCQRIEELILSVPQVDLCGVVVASDDERINVPVAYLVLKQGNPKKQDDEVITKIRKMTQEELPEHMRPIEFSVINKMPLTASGKIDYRELEKLTEEHRGK